MLSNTAKLVLATAALALVATSADAQTHRRCLRAKDKVRCTCIMANGGQTYQRPGGGRRLVAMQWAHADRISQCLHRAGRQ
jgi:hypothetical protein